MVAGLSFAHAASAQDDAESAPALKKVAPKARVVTPPAPAPVPPSMKLSLAVAPFPQLWTVRVENTGELPLRLLADARLVTLDVLANGAKASVTCTLPSTMRPSGDSERGLVVPAKRAYAEAFDPRLYCFGEARAAVLADGATVTAHLGFAVPKATRWRAPRIAPPYVVAPIDGVEPRVSAAKELVAAPVVIDAASALPSRTASAAPAPATTPSTEPATSDAPSSTAPFAVGLTPWIDASLGADALAAVTVTNTGAAVTSLRLRPAAVTLEITGPNGTTSCDWANPPGPPARELMTRVAPGGKTSISVLLGTLCDDPPFDDAGFYTVRARLDASRLTGEGSQKPVETASKTVSFVRVRQSRTAKPTERPKLQTN